MELVSGDCRLPAALAGGALALGNFDGVHRGHQAVIGAALAWARARGRPALVASFDPHPSRFFRPDAPPFALTTPAQKLARFEALGVDGAALIPFNAALAGLTADAFARDWLGTRLQVAHVVTGEDFTFGKGRSGDAQTLATLGAANGFTAEAIAPVADGDGAGQGPISSTRIRDALRAGDTTTAAALLGRPFAIAAPVIHGDKRGRSIGIPTANQLLGDYVRPRYGVYAVRVRLPDSSRHRGVANLGIRPMFAPPVELLETWILDWSGDLYGATIEVELVAFLRAELKLEGLEALQAQVHRDAEAARAALAA
jgi:riboflavin kinase/FMN adenylyltransferase